ncbi:hypothetical protein ERICV_01738 [Paenibacillus larvae subsp. larvae]|uniref:Uncharacterized protein n=1 Tax=Paenibacillus larvae subsp. larvae TaxID=147375 RepID=A0A2L1U2F7_9BACL|nr:hypothetical protein ERICIII_02983 [Paenibacillus larvae subsp. larvae]AVF27591.1 hypothetical protein ERICIII_03481 [Paenibacillus larvae subsp. larvae]QHZ50680.1 hypothetical protein ERICV_01522 [Paenibacillus larvae subsp. larvae]QHZ50893.1 hypothetical protein ERICV_01738 [Paenibacillus larvae subsp. larvae]
MNGQIDDFELFDKDFEEFLRRGIEQYQADKQELEEE